jgi:hypothetical protein
MHFKYTRGGARGTEVDAEGAEGDAEAEDDILIFIYLLFSL